MVRVRAALHALGAPIMLRGGKWLTLRANSSQQTTLDAGGLSRHFIVQGGAQLTLHGLRLVNGFGKVEGGAILARREAAVHLVRADPHAVPLPLQRVRERRNQQLVAAAQQRQLDAALLGSRRSCLFVFGLMIARRLESIKIDGNASMCCFVSRKACIRCSTSVFSNACIIDSPRSVRSTMDSVPATRRRTVQL